MKKIYFVGIPSKAKGVEDFNFIAEHVPGAEFYWFCLEVDSFTKRKYHKINFVTGLNDQQMHLKIKKEMDLFVSCSHYEGFCLPIAEALLLKKPVISYALDEVRSSYSENIEYIDCFQLTRYIDRINEIILKNNYLKDKKEVRKYVIKNYSPKVVVGKLLKVLF